MRKKSFTIILYVCILFVFFGSSKKVAFGQISASFEQTEVKKLAKLIAKQSSHGFLSTNVPTHIVDYEISDATEEEALEHLLKDTDYQARLYEDTIVLLPEEQFPVFEKILIDSNEIAIGNDVMSLDFTDVNFSQITKIISKTGNEKINFPIENYPTLEKKVSISMTDYTPGKVLKLLSAACGGFATIKQGEIAIEVYKQP